MSKKETQGALAEQKPQGGVLAAPVDEAMYASDAGHGMESADAESFAIPFLAVIQKSSPQVDEGSSEFMEGAKAGMFFDNISKRLYDGKKGVLVVPCAFKRTFLRWGPRDGGGGFKGENAPEAIAEMRAKGEIVEMDNKLLAPLPDGTVNEKKCDRFADTRNHYVLLLDEATGAWKEALLSLSSTQIKKSKMLMSALGSVKLNGPGGMFTPPTYANMVRITTVPESNDKGSWHGVKFDLEGNVKRAEVYAAAKAFHGSVAKGSVVAKYEDAAGDPAPGGEGAGF